MTTLQQRPSWAWKPQTIHRAPNDEFFKDGDIICEQDRKQFVVRAPADEDEEEFSSVPHFKCQAAGCTHIFKSIQEYESHYNSQHRYPCVQCKHSFPNSHLLDIHITEWHNPMFEELSRTQNMFRCLLETCSEKFKDYQQRKDHMIRVHKYPANFRFDKPPKEKRPQRRHTDERQMEMEIESSNTQESEVFMNSPSKETPSVDCTVPKTLSALAYSYLSVNSGDVDVQDSKNIQSSILGLTSNSKQIEMSAEGSQTAEKMSVDGQEDKSQRTFVYKMTNVPKNICFGSGSQRGFQSWGHGGKKGRRRHWYQTKKENTESNIEEVNMAEMADALDS